MKNEQGAMKYLITMTDIQGAWDGLAEREQTRILRQHEEFTEALQSAGAFVAVYHLHPRHERRPYARTTLVSRR
jgi:hypothetical protein